jgi:hypothetical protein
LPRGDVDARSAVLASLRSPRAGAHVGLPLDVNEEAG